MIVRTCPKCGFDWLGDDTVQDWQCEKCGAVLTKRLNQRPKEYPERQIEMKRPHLYIVGRMEAANV